ncbi:hypothetical protein FB566_1847 [Stackebrandtia endophytica]|uniref:Uncharacterized protein n=2 Tax=Stackebrandtia endophytica TaxID=1496996 RepID=A0A543AUR8_9ACTN|nr:hypothetical protein FB566_1847 [Stackebrandtia endophytica]
MLKGEADKAAELARSIEDAPWTESGALLTAVCGILAEERFEADESPAAIRVFVDEMLQNYADADPPLKPLMCEVAARVALGELQLLKGLDLNDLAIHQMAFMNKIVQDAELSPGEIDELLDDAMTLVEEL